MIVDDTWAYIGSANLNGRSMRWDAESGYVIHDRAVVTAFRKELFKEHIKLDAETKEIRTFYALWDSMALKGKTEPDECTSADLKATAAVFIQNPPEGQKYNGPGSWLGITEYFYDRNA
jgi:phosphatidylserine/phosphatidylglycerophosphate/cardiolipin synthase-like enzyme